MLEGAYGTFIALADIESLDLRDFYLHIMRELVEYFANN